MTKLIELIPAYDRSRVTTDWKCPRARFLGYEVNGRGLAKETTSLPLSMGIAIHDSLATIAMATRDGFTPNIDDIATRAERQVRESLLEVSAGLDEKVTFAFEQGALVEGLIRGYYRFVWPRLVSQYPLILAVEEEMEYHHDGLIFMSKPDLIMGNDDTIVYVEFKSTASKREDWVNSWDTAVQLHSTIKAVEATKGLVVDSVIVQGLFKGFISYGRQNSVFCYAYKKFGNPPFTQDVVSYEYKAGLKRFPTWEMPGGVKAWVEGMPDATLQEQFPQTPPIMINQELVDAFFRQRATREHEIATASGLLNLPQDPEENQALLDRVFPQKWESCSPAYGGKCDFLRLCHSEVSDPLTSGFRPRDPHHALEMLRMEPSDV